MENVKVGKAGSFSKELALEPTPKQRERDSASVRVRGEASWAQISPMILGCFT